MILQQTAYLLPTGKCVCVCVYQCEGEEGGGRVIRVRSFYMLVNF